MSVLNELLEYQKVDGELRKVEQEIAATPERKKYVQAKKFMKSAAEKLEIQDNRAKELRRTAQELTRRYMEISKSLSEFSGLDEMVDGGGDVSFYKRNAQALADSLRALKNEINKLVSAIESACDEYKKLKEQTIVMQKQYKEYSEKYTDVKNSRAAEVAEITGRLKAIEKKIPADIVAKYTAKRNERIFPVLAALRDGRCVCGMDFPIAQQERLSGGNVIECEHCHRLIYKAEP